MVFSRPQLEKVLASMTKTSPWHRKGSGYFLRPKLKASGFGFNNKALGEGSTGTWGGGMSLWCWGATGGLELGGVEVFFFKAWGG